MKNTKLTSVKILEAIYNRFKLNTVNTKMTLQKLTNRSVDRFLTDDKFREEIDELTKEPRYWAFIKYDDKIGQRDAGDLEIDLPQQGEKLLANLKHPNWQKENM